MSLGTFCYDSFNTLKDLAGWVNMDDPTDLINHPALARAVASIPQAVRRVAAKLRKLMKRERLGIRTMFECLDVDGSGSLEVHELHVEERANRWME